MLIQLPRSRVLYALALFALMAVPLQAQTIDDGIMLRQRELLTGNFYSHDSWDEYWEGALKRTNGNIGTITTKTNVFTANYGLFDRFNVIGTVPYVWTNASQGVLHGIQGFQDLTLAGKWTAHEKPAGDGVLRTILVVAAGIPLTNYNTELLPLSIGLGSTRVSWRGTVNYQTTPGWYVNGTTAYTVRSHVKLDRPYYQTGDEFVITDRVDMPNVFDYTASGGYMKDGLMAAAFFSLMAMWTVGRGLGWIGAQLQAWLLVLVVMLAGLFWYDCYGSFLRLIRYGGGIEVTVHRSAPAAPAERTGRLLWMTESQIVLFDPATNIVEEIPRTKSGKLQAVICRLSEGERQAVLNGGPGEPVPL